MALPWSQNGWRQAYHSAEREPGRPALAQPVATPGAGFTEEPERALPFDTVEAADLC